VLIQKRWGIIPETAVCGQFVHYAVLKMANWLFFTGFYKTLRWTCWFLGLNL